MYVNIFKHLLLWNHWADWSQILYGAFLGRGNKIFVQTVQVPWPRWPPCPYMVKKLKKSSSPEPNGRWPWNLVCSIGCASTIKFIQMMILGWPWPILQQGQIWSHMLLYGDFFRNYCRLWFETSNKWPKWKEGSLDIKTLSPGRCMPPAPGLYTCIKSWKKCIKSDLKEISLKLATNG